MPGPTYHAGLWAARALHLLPAHGTVAPVLSGGGRQQRRLLRRRIGARGAWMCLGMCGGHPPSGCPATRK